MSAWHPSPEPHSFVYIGNCPVMTGPFVTYVSDSWGDLDHVEDITYRTFIKWAERGTARWWYEMWGYPLSKDWHVSYHKSQTPSGIPVVYFVWSAMEHFFIPKDDVRDFDLAHETRLAEEAQR
jgi:hypothetical protein